MINDINIEIRELFYKHFPEIQTTEPLQNFILELGTLVQQVIAKALKQEYKEGAVIPIRELEELLVVIRQAKALYEEKEQHTTDDILKIDELKQLEYKLTEKILTNR